MNKLLCLPLVFLWIPGVCAEQQASGHKTYADALNHRSETVCGELSSYRKFSACESSILEEADALLNDQYKELVDYLDPANRKNLVRAQRLWLKFRDADCSFAEPRSDENSSWISANRTSCLARTTIERLRHLEQYNASWNKGCNGCPW